MNLVPDLHFPYFQYAIHSGQLVYVLAYGGFSWRYSGGYLPYAAHCAGHLLSTGFPFSLIVSIFATIIPAARSSADHVIVSRNIRRECLFICHLICFAFSQEFRMELKSIVSYHCQVLRFAHVIRFISNQ